MSAVKASEPPPHIAAVIDRLRTIETSAPASDGVVCFARLYRGVTEGVAAELSSEGVADARFVETLDVRFADLFFSALQSYVDEPARTPSAWVPLFSERSRRGIARIFHRFRRIDDVVAMWNVDRARDAAWTNAQALWALGGEPPLAGDYLLALDRMVGLASRGLLIPADTWLLKVRRALDLRGPSF